MFPDPLTEEEHEELVNAIGEFFLYRAQQTRVIITCAVILVVLVLLAIWIL